MAQWVQDRKICGSSPCHSERSLHSENKALAELLPLHQAQA